MSSIIQVENVSKLYRLGASQQQSYTALRDVVAEKAKALVQGFGNKNKSPESKANDFWALKNVSFEINQGDRVGVIGRNGAGKSTLLKVLSRITAPTKGKITIHGRLASLLEVGTGFHPELTGRENIFLNGAILGMSKPEIARKFDEIVEFAEVEKFLDTPVKRYSSGMHMRLAFAVAAHLEPDVLVVDEILAVGDAQFQKKCIGKMQDVGQQGRTVIFVSHDIRAIRALCQSAILMRSGVASEILSVQEAVSLYSSDVLPTATKFPIVHDDIIIHNYKATQAGEWADELDGGEKTVIVVDGEIRRPLTSFRLGIQIKTLLGADVCRSLTSDWNVENEIIAPGRYLFSITIPANFLAPGSFIINLTASRYGVQDYLSHDHIDLHTLVRSPVKYNLAHLGEPVPGSVIIAEPWSIKKIEAGV